MKKYLSVFLCLVVAVTLGVFFFSAPAAEAGKKDCPNGKDYTYLSRDVEQCMAMMWICPDGQEQFFNECGCGCKTMGAN